jgi:hypothetical protein
MFTEHKRFFYLNDPGASLTYGRIGDPMGLPVRGRNGVETSGSSTTVTASDGTPFDPVSAGDLIHFLTGNPPEDEVTDRKVDTKTDGTEITVDSAVDLSEGTPFFFEPFRSGTGDGDGWHGVRHWSAITVFADLVTLASTSIDLVVEGLGGPYSTPVPLATATLSVVGKTPLEISSVVSRLRVGLKANGNMSGDEVTVWAVGEMLQGV